MMNDRPSNTVVEKAKRALASSGPLARCQIALIGQGLSDEAVLVQTRLRFPERATIETVKWYRHKVNVVRRHEGLLLLPSSGSSGIRAGTNRDNASLAAGLNAMGASEVLDPPNESDEARDEFASPMSRQARAATDRSTVRQSEDDPPIEFREFVRDDKRSEAYLERAREIATKLLDHLVTEEMLGSIRQQHRHGARSQSIQDCFTGFLSELGFRSEAQGLFRTFAVADLRPDFYLPLGGGETGIIVEVERGRTTANNMDLLDVWKCHICQSADFLFLIVPKFRLDEKGRPSRKEFDRVSNRIASFFEPRNYINVHGLWLFGY